MLVNVNPIMAAIVEAADTLNTAPDDYINPDDGLKYCGKCHTPKEAYLPLSLLCCNLRKRIVVLRF